MKQKYTSGSAVASFVFGTVPRAHRRETLGGKKDGQPERCGFKYTKRNKISHKHHQEPDPFLLGLFIYM